MTKITIVFPSDPAGSKIGGAKTFLDDFIKFAPADFDIDFIGVTSDNIYRPVKKWRKLSVGEKTFNFYPLLLERHEDNKDIIPLSLRFSLKLRFSGLRFSERVILFNRIEPALLLIHVKSPKLAIVHNDVRKQLDCRSSEVLWSWFPGIYLKTEDIIFKSLDHVYAVSKNTIAFYQGRFPHKKEKFSFLPTWVDRSVFYPTNEPKISIRKKINFTAKAIPVDKKWILYVGRLQQQKAPLRLIEAFSVYNRDKGNSCLVICGEGNLRSEAERCAKRMGLENDIFFLGGMKRLELADIYRAADCFLLASNFEGMPLSVLEALGCGLPVVTTDVGEVRLVVKNGYSGEVVSSFDPRELAAGLGNILNSFDRYTEKNCVNCIGEYSPEVVLDPVYKRIAALHKGYIS